MTSTALGNVATVEQDVGVWGESCLDGGDVGGVFAGKRRGGERTGTEIDFTGGAVAEDMNGADAGATGQVLRDLVHAVLGRIQHHNRGVVRHILEQGGHVGQIVLDEDDLRRRIMLSCSRPSPQRRHQRIVLLIDGHVRRIGCGSGAVGIDDLVLMLHRIGDQRHTGTIEHHARLQYAPGRYGPYAANLRQVLIKLEGHLLQGYGDGDDAPGKPIELLDGAVDEARTFLDGQPDVLARIERVAALIEGFEDPYGMELLSSVHWMMCRDAAARDNAEAAVAAVHAWNERKRKALKAEHLVTAWQRLKQTHWDVESRSAIH